MSTAVPRIAITPGEPAGIGPDLVVALTQQDHTCQLVAVADPELLAGRARELGIALDIEIYAPDAQLSKSKAGRLLVDPIAMQTACRAGKLDSTNGPYVLRTLEHAGKGCIKGEFDALVTGPVQKSTIAESGTPFTGHTEYFAKLCNVETPVMLLCADNLRVALLTTHLPLRDVPDAITADTIKTICRILDSELDQKFGIVSPRIAVLGLNPHAGEAGQLGTEDQEIILPTLSKLRRMGLNLAGPLPADSAFTKTNLQNFDAVLAMYHDQGLPVLKHAGFGNAVNVTLGLPIVRTSVDHGTALELAGTGTADTGSLRAALSLAVSIVTHSRA